MAEVNLSDALVNALSKQINITLYPVNDFAVDLGFDFAAASAAEELAIRKQHPQGKYEHLLQQFVATHGRGAKAAQDLVDRFKVKQKMLLVNFLEDALGKAYQTEAVKNVHEKGSAHKVKDDRLMEVSKKGTTGSSHGLESANDKPTEESREQDFDDHLKTVAKKIHKDIDIDSLGKELGFEPAEISRYMQTNEKYQTITYMGSLNMLRDWRNNTARSEESEKLKKALIAINHRRLADDLLSDDMAS